MTLPERSTCPDCGSRVWASIPGPCADCEAALWDVYHKDLQNVAHANHRMVNGLGSGTERQDQRKDPGDRRRGKK